MSSLNPELEARWKMARNLDVEAFQKAMVEEGHEEPSERVALAALHKARVWLADNGHMSKQLGRDSKRWLEREGLSR